MVCFLQKALPDRAIKKEKQKKGGCRRMSEKRKEGRRGGFHQTLGVGGKE